MEKCSIEEKPSFKRSLKRLDEHTKKRLREAVNTLRQNPLLGKPLKGKLRKLWRYRVGKYRIVYLPQPCHITLVLVGHRETIYP